MEGSLIYHQGKPVIFYLTAALYKYILNACFLLTFHDGTTVEYGTAEGPKSHLQAESLSNPQTAAGRLQLCFRF